MRSNPVFKRVISLTRIPHRIKLSIALKQFTSDSLKALGELNSQLTDAKDWAPEDLLLFISSFSAQKHSISELKTSLALGSIPSNTYYGNSVYMQMRQMAYNLATSMQYSMLLDKRRKPNKKCTRVHRIMEWRTFRFLIMNCAGRIAWQNEKKYFS